MQRQSKRGKTVVIVAVSLAAFAFLAFVALRPATFVGVDGPTLTHSLGGGDGPIRGAESECKQESQSSMWRCSISDGGSGSTTYLVRTKEMGCWEAWRGDRPIEGREPTDTGCIHLLDVILKN